MSIRVLLSSKHKVVSEGIAAVLRTHQDMDVVGIPSSTANPDFSRFRLSGLNKIKHLQLMF